MEMQSPFACERCNRNFSSNEELENHYKQVHPALEDDTSDVSLALLKD
jgi:hypothetical protein